MDPGLRRDDEHGALRRTTECEWIPASAGMTKGVLDPRRRDLKPAENFARPAINQHQSDRLPKLHSAIAVANRIGAHKPTVRGVADETPQSEPFLDLDAIPRNRHRTAAMQP